ncbi:MAG TPA: iron transporter [Steroidobacteraceae bacterium]|nr:iron transporter [Steroidobacteraceae bacterium]
MPKLPASLALTAVAIGACTTAGAAEFYVGEPVVKNGLQIVPNYLLGIEMAGKVPGMSMDPDAVHLEADVHATKDEAHNLPEDTWIPYLTIKYRLHKSGSKFTATGTLQPMIARDGLHYANGVKMDGPGEYHLSYSISQPAIYRHVDSATGVKAWWQPFTVEWDFKYPSRNK